MIGLYRRHERLGRFRAGTCRRSDRKGSCGTLALSPRVVGTTRRQPPWITFKLFEGAFPRPSIYVTKNRGVAPQICWSLTANGRDCVGEACGDIPTVIFPALGNGRRGRIQQRVECDGLLGFGRPISHPYSFFHRPECDGVLKISLLG